MQPLRIRISRKAEDGTRGGRNSGNVLGIRSPLARLYHRDQKWLVAGTSRKNATFVWFSFSLRNLTCSGRNNTGMCFRAAKKTNSIRDFSALYLPDINRYLPSRSFYLHATYYIDTIKIHYHLLKHFFDRQRLITPRLSCSLL